MSLNWLPGLDSLFSWSYLASLFVSMFTSRCVRLCRVREGVAVQHFTFVLTDLEGSQRFGFCRLTSSTHTCLCILRYMSILQSTPHAELSLKRHYESHSLDNHNLLDHSYLPWFEVFYKLLNNLADYLTKGQVSVRRSYVSALFYEYRSHITLSYSPQIKEMKVLLANLYKQPMPLKAGSVTLQMVNF